MKIPIATMNQKYSKEKLLPKKFAKCRFFMSYRKPLSKKRRATFPSLEKPDRLHKPLPTSSVRNRFIGNPETKKEN